MKIILGSQSKGRQQVLRDAGVEFELERADIDEKAIRHDDYEALPLLIAGGKADALTARLGQQDALLLTADTVVTYRGELREKPTSPEQARAFLASYQPSEPAWVNTGIVVTNLRTGKRVQGFSKSAVFFREIPLEVIEQAIAEGYIFGCAGGFAIETELLEPYVQRIEGEATGVVGLPLSLARRLLDDATS